MRSNHEIRWPRSTQPRANDPWPLGVFGGCMKHQGTFLVLWTLAVVATTSAFVLHLALRARSIELGYELGREHGHLARLREVKRALELEKAAYETPERVEFIARSLLGMTEPGPDRIVPVGEQPTVEEESVTLAEARP